MRNRPMHVPFTMPRVSSVYLYQLLKLDLRCANRVHAHTRISNSLRFKVARTISYENRTGKNRARLNETLFKRSYTGCTFASPFL